MSQKYRSLSPTEILRDQKKPVFFISPHLDDAVLSCGALISELAKNTDVTILSIFTDAHSFPATFSARRFLQHCNESSARKLFEKRREEDKAAAKILGAKQIHLNKIDGTWRMYEKPSLIRQGFGKLIPELLHLYPTFLHVRLSRLHPEDRRQRKLIYEKMKKIIPKDAVIFAPLAIGTHVDHLFTRETVSLFENVIYWSDFPYNLKYKMPATFIKKHALKEFRFEKSTRSKEEAIKKYVTQLPSLFPDGEIPYHAEVYYAIK